MMMVNSVKKRSQRWSVSDFVTIGVFATMMKCTSLIVALLGGGLNPLTLMAKNAIYILILITAVYKVGKAGSLMLMLLVGQSISILIMGTGVTQLPAMMVAALMGELLIYLFGRYQKLGAIIFSSIAVEMVMKSWVTFEAYLRIRNTPELVTVFTVMIVIVTVGLVGSFIGALLSVPFIKELRHAGIIR